ncbi:hypothetical protein, conserved [Leishmania donovani]|uniref:Cilia- and flagella-associated protein 300 n=1 Tax=Leishmania donovani TaxID=5661 RepID=A0A3S7X4F5_LEIDO|nr:hypothetical protein, conserved [Leishmania donovani]AYU81307.1 protein of unknown function (DUF4498), putative [Leishmania donovani]TPP42654.1 hypothetical protein CGC21_11695 [Leishmania donovani]CBZ36513.1 hypothetical protein, conserved [Leishmania donovani]
MFVFEQAAPSSAAADVSACASFSDAEPYKSLFMKWGLLRLGEWNMHTYRYRCPSEVPSFTEGTLSAQPVASPSSCRAANAAAATVSAVALRFHDGVAADFLRSLFAAPCVRSDLVGDDAHHAQSVLGANELQFRPLTCRWTTLEPLRHGLVDAKVVRQVLRDVDGATVRDANQPVYFLPTVKRAEELLPHGEVISDELRALFLRAHSRPVAQAKGECGELYDASSREDTDTDDDDMWGSMSGARLPMRQLRGVFGKESREEFLYHVVWRLVAGSGPLNQFDDDAAVYLDAARELYRRLVKSLHVVEATEQEADGDVAALEEPNSASVRYHAVVGTSVYQVITAPGMTLFPRSDGVHPSNLNYCYVAVNPSEQTATVWYHRC